jgi:hypothetical protein
MECDSASQGDGARFDLLRGKTPDTHFPGETRNTGQVRLILTGMAGSRLPLAGRAAQRA